MKKVKKNVIMGCYGIGLVVLWVQLLKLSDEKGIIWPESTIAPFKSTSLLPGKD
jgi:prolyl-tRNA synthetase